MSEPREPIETITFIDQYGGLYREVFSDVRSFEYFKRLQLGLITELPRKSLPAIAKAVGLSDNQALHHFVANSPWDVDELRQRRLAITKKLLNGRPCTLCIDETGDKKKGKTTDYVARQYIGNLGKLENGMVSVNAYGVLDNITFPLLFKVFKPRQRLKQDDEYQTKPELAIEIIKELIAFGFQFDVVLADCLYGESSHFIEEVAKLELNVVVAIRNNHGVWLGPGQRIRFTKWRTYERVFCDGEIEIRYIREIIFGQRQTIRYYQLTTDPDEQPEETTILIMTNLPGAIRTQVGNMYGLRTWVEYGFKQVKNERGWADYRLTDFEDIERWWELVFSAYLMISMQAPVFRSVDAQDSDPDASVYRRHPWWDSGAGWKNILNNIRLIIQPYIFCCLLTPWLSVFDIPHLQESFGVLTSAMNSFRCYVPV